MGISSAGDDYGRRISNVFDDIVNCRRVVEDFVLYSESYSEHQKLVRAFLKRAQENNISLNLKKFAFAAPKASFAGYVIDAEGFRPDPALTEAIRLFRRP